MLKIGDYFMDSLNEAIRLIVYAVQNHPFVVAGIGLLFLFLLLFLKSGEMVAWGVRAVVFFLVLTALYFAFQKYKYLIPSSHEPPAIRDDSLTPEKHAGTKYYQDPDERLRENQ